MLIRVRALVGIGSVLALGLAALPAAAQVFDVPPGFEVVDDHSRAGDGAWRGLLTVRPQSGMFAGLSTIHLREVTSPVDDPDAWLTNRMSVDVGSTSAARDILRSPDSPFGDPAFDGLREALPKLFAGLEELSKVPLKFCSDPTEAYNASGSLRELFCEFEVGPFRQFIILRLQETDGRRFFTEIRAMNERRLRHLVAIANSFEP